MFFEKGETMSEEEKKFLEIVDLKKGFGSGETRQEVLRGMNFSVAKGEFCVLLGPSGSGKSTLLNIIGGIDSADCGYISINGDKLEDMSEKKLRRYLGTEIGMVFQDCKAALCPVRKIGVQIHEAVSAHEKISKKETRIRAGEIMKKIGMDDYERVGICAAMNMHPNLLLADEPTSALDVTVQKQVVEELLMMRKEYQTAMILVTHNIGVVRAMADRILVLQNGTVRDYGETKNVLDHSQNPYTQKLMNSVLHLKREHI